MEYILGIDTCYQGKNESVFTIYIAEKVENNNEKIIAIYTGRKENNGR